jgi:hypothetical protein
VLFYPALSVKVSLGLAALGPSPMASSSAPKDGEHLLLVKHGALEYMSGFGNDFSSEALPGALPAGQNSPQIVSGVSHQALLLLNRVFFLRSLKTMTQLRIVLWTVFHPSLWFQSCSVPTGCMRSNLVGLHLLSQELTISARKCVHV